MKKTKLLLLLFLALQSCTQNKESFALCGMGIAKPYYYTGLKYKGEIYQIEKEVSKHYIPISTNNTGIAKIRFKVNCKGELEEIAYEEYNLNYQKVNLNDSLEVQIRSIVTGLNDWIPGMDEDGQTVNSHSFLSFRILDGQIQEILPK